MTVNLAEAMRATFKGVQYINQIMEEKTAKQNKLVTYIKNKIEEWCGNRKNIIFNEMKERLINLRSDPKIRNVSTALYMNFLEQALKKTNIKNTEALLSEVYKELNNKEFEDYDCVNSPSRDEETERVIQQDNRMEWAIEEYNKNGGLFARIRKRELRL